MPDEPKFTALYHPGKKQIACVLVQAAFGMSSRPVNLFDDWLTSPDDGLKAYTGTLEQWRKVAKGEIELT